MITVQVLSTLEDPLKRLKSSDSCREEAKECFFSLSPAATSADVAAAGSPTSSFPPPPPPPPDSDPSSSKEDSKLEPEAVSSSRKGNTSTA